MQTKDGGVYNEALDPSVKTFFYGFNKNKICKFWVNARIVGWMTVRRVVNLACDTALKAWLTE